MDDYKRKEKLRVQVLNNISKKEHFHQDIELLYVLEGEMNVSLGEHQVHMKPEDILVINANKKHSFQASENILYAKLSIDYTLFTDIFHGTNVIIWCDSTKGNHERYEELRHKIKKLLNHHLSNKGEVDNFGHIALCYEIMDFLSVHFLVRKIDKENTGIKDTIEDRFEERIDLINNYIRANYMNRISLKELSEKLYLSDAYLSRFFKKNYGMTFAEYLENIRLYHAVDELLYTNSPITMIAYNNGFSTVAAFNKAFKKAYHETPSVVRKKSQIQNESEQTKKDRQILNERLEKFLRDDGEQIEEKWNVQSVAAVCDVRHFSKMKYHWSGILNVGSAAELLKSGVQEHIITLKETMEFQYVRFWNVFSREMLFDLSSEEKEYNFSKVDSIIDFLLQNDLKPHIELGQKPKRLFKNIQEPLIQETCEKEAADLEKWENLIQEMMRHLLRRYGKRELDDWHMELWFDENKWKRKNFQEEYLKMFEMTADIVKRYNDRIEVGGCGIRSNYKAEDISEFLVRWKNREIQPDFLSVLYYGYEQGQIDQDQYAKRTTDNERFLHGIQRIRDILEQLGYNHVKLYVTEWNLTISDRNYINDTCFKGAYILKNMMDLYGLVDESAYFLGSDRVTDYFDSNELFHGGTGLISKDGILKPAGFAYEFLNRLYSGFVTKGSNYLITTDGRDSYRIVCHNQKKLNYNYYLSKENDIEKEHIWKYFEDRDPLEIEISLNGVSDGVYQVKMYSINETNGSVLNIWSEMQFEKELSRNDIKYFRRICEPKLTMKKYKVSEQCLKLNTKMAANEIAVIQIRRLIE